MIAFVEGEISELTPAYVVINTGGIGYHINISLYTFDKIQGKNKCLLYTHLAIREDAHVLFGFIDKKERELFRQLISVSGIGPSVSRMILSSMDPAEIINAIISGNVSLLKSVKGIGPKSAQRIIVELQDTLKKVAGEDVSDTNLPEGSKIADEAREALIMLGFKKNEADKALARSLKNKPAGLGVEDLIKLALKNL